MDILIDSREKAKAIKKIISTFDKCNVRYASSKLFVGDYQSLDNPRLVIDRKQNLSELYTNLCQQHKRFREELLRANNHDIRLVFLIEHGGKIKSLEDVKEWNNPRVKTSPYAWNGERMYKTMVTVMEKYKTDFIFCDKMHTGLKIIELLGGGDNVCS